MILNDIKREVDLARSGDGGGNFLAGLGLLCYTEFMGTIVLKSEGTSTKRFNTFFKSMGGEYTKLVEVNKVDVYAIFRCGMAHIYFARNCDVKMCNDNNYQAGIIIQPNGTYLFIVEKYFEDFIDACTNLYNKMIEEQNPYLLST